MKTREQHVADFDAKVRARFGEEIDRVHAERAQIEADENAIARRKNNLEDAERDLNLRRRKAGLHKYPVWEGDLPGRQGDK